MIHPVLCQFAYSDNSIIAEVMQCWNYTNLHVLVHLCMHTLVQLIGGIIFKINIIRECLLPFSRNTRERKQQKIMADRNLTADDSLYPMNIVIGSRPEQLTFVMAPKHQKQPCNCLNSSCIICAIILCKQVGTCLTKVGPALPISFIYQSSF